MKNPRPILASIALAVVLSFPGCGQGSKTPPPPTNAADDFEARQERAAAAKWNVRVDVQIVELPEARALELVPGLRSDDAQKVAAALAQLQQMIAAKEATLIGWPEVICIDGDRTVAETIEEQRYPVEFDPLGASAPETSVAPATNETPSTPAPEATPKLEGALVDADVTTAMPNMWESRNVGVTLEAEAKVLDEGRRLLVNVVPQHVRNLGFEPFDAGLDAAGRQLYVQQPKFATTKIQTSLSVRNDQHVLLNMHKIEGDEAKVELFILHAVASKVE